jgi:hypothetical protein
MAGTQNQPLEYEQISYNAPDGSQWGRVSTEKLGMYGATPVSRYVGCGAASTYGTTTNTTAVFGFDSLAAVTSMILQVSTLTTALRNVGMID